MPKFQKFIYLASPYSHSDKNVITKRVLEVQDATARLIERGHLIFSPIVHSHCLLDSISDPNAQLSFEFWLDYDRAMIDKADELWILRLDGHTRSKGVHAELYHALDRGIPVRYINYPDLSTFSEVECCSVAPDGLPDVWEKELPVSDYGKINTWGEPFPTGPIQKPVIIGLTGHARSGKDTAGKYLVENRGFTRIGLADAVKDCLYALDPEYKSDVPGTDVVWTIQEHVDQYGWESAKNYSQVRKYLQRMGTEVGREIISPTVWLDIAERKIKELGPTARVVITDIRFPNEAEWVRSLGGQVVRINRPGFGPVNDHASDARLDDALVDVEVESNYGIDNLYGQIETRVIPYV